MTSLNRSLLSAAPCLIAVSFAGSAHAATVYNVNFGDGSFVINASDQYKGAATEADAAGNGDVTWNNFNGDTNGALAGAKLLADSTGSSGAGVTMTITAGGATTVSVGTNSDIASADTIFGGWVKENTNSTQFNVSISGLSATATYDLLIYSAWRWGHANDDQRVTLTAGSGLAGTYYVTTGDHARGALPSGLMADSDAAEGVSTDPNANYSRINGLSADGSGVLAFDTSGRNTPLSGFQLVEVPEPSSLALLGMGGLLIARRRRG